MSNPMQRTVVLVQRAQQGDQEAANEIFQRYGPRLLALVRVRLRGELRRQMESVDVQQEVMLRAYRGLERFDMRGEKAFLYYLLAILENFLRDKGRANRARRRDPRREVALDAREGSQSFSLPDKKARPPSQDLRQREDEDSLADCFRRLRPEHRQLITMRDRNDWSWETIGKELGTSPDAARLRHKTARSALDRLWHQRRRPRAG